MGRSITHRPVFDLIRGLAQNAKQIIKSILRVILGAQRLGQIIPRRLRHIKVKPRQQNRALRQLGDRFHQLERGAARSSGTGYYNWFGNWALGPFFGQMRYNFPLKPLFVRIRLAGI